MSIININNLNNNYIIDFSLDKHEYKDINIITEDEYQQHFLQIKNEVKICTEEKIVDVNQDEIYNTMSNLINYLSAGKFDNQSIEHIDQSIIDDSNQLISFLIDNYSHENIDALNSDDKLANIIYQKFEEIIANTKGYITNQTNIDVSINNGLNKLINFAITAITMNYIGKNIVNIQQQSLNKDENKQSIVVNATNNSLSLLHAVYNNLIQS